QATALVRRSSKIDALKALGVRLAVADLHSGDGVAEAASGAEVAYHVAGVTKARSEEDYLRGNAETTRMLASVLARQKRPPRLVLCSSLAAAGPAPSSVPPPPGGAPPPGSLRRRGERGPRTGA